MTKSRRILVAALLAAVVTALAWQLFHSREPRYQGKALSAWLADLNTGPIVQGDYTGETHDTAADAFRHIGTNALPQLLNGLRAKDSPLKSACLNALRNHREFRNIFHPADETRASAAQGFKALGPMAKPAIPELTVILNDPDTSLESAFCLLFIGKDGVLPLVQALTNNQPRVQHWAAFALCHKPTLAQPAVPTFLKLLSDPDADVRTKASWALKIINPEAAAKAGVN
jgi:HEAT repeat protein